MESKSDNPELKYMKNEVLDNAKNQSVYVLPPKLKIIKGIILNFIAISQS